MFAKSIRKRRVQSSKCTALPLQLNSSLALWLIGGLGDIWKGDHVSGAEFERIVCFCFQETRSAEINFAQKQQVLINNSSKPVVVVGGWFFEKTKHA